VAEEHEEEAEVAVEVDPGEEPLGPDLGHGFDDEYDVDLSAAGREALRGAAEGLKRAVSSGIRTVLAADETLRETLPREVPAYVARQLEATRRDLVDAIAQQTRVFLENIDLGAEAKKHLQEGRLEITTSIRFVSDEPEETTHEEVATESVAEETEE